MGLTFNTVELRQLLMTLSCDAANVVLQRGGGLLKEGSGLEGDSSVTPAIPWRCPSSSVAWELQDMTA
jgi:hypothetical protein